jgi:hypothetical protein
MFRRIAIFMISSPWTERDIDLEVHSDPNYGQPKFSLFLDKIDTKIKYVILSRCTKHSHMNVPDILLW